LLFFAKQTDNETTYYSTSIMSEESKIPDGDYVMMSGGGGNGRPTSSSSIMSSSAASTKVAAADHPLAFLDDPTLTQEEKDHRLAIALQKQENAAAYKEHQKKAEEHMNAQKHRTARSGTYTKLAAVRDKDGGMLSVPAAYSTENAYKVEGTFQPGFAASSPPLNATPQEITDHKLALQLQKVEQVDAGTVRTMQKMVEKEELIEETQAIRTVRSKCTL
jgi:hypothetical protein